MPRRLLSATALGVIACGRVPEAAPTLVGRWIGGVYSLGAYAPLRITIAGESHDSVQAELVGFSFLGFGTIDAEARRHGDSVTIALHDRTERVHQLRGSLAGDRVVGTYESDRGIGRFYLRRLGPPSLAPEGVGVTTGLYRGRRGEVAVRAVEQGDIALADFSTGVRRRAVRLGADTYVHGRLYDDWSEDGGRVRTLAGGADVTGPLVWDRRQPDGSQAVDTLTRVPLVEHEVRFRNGPVTLAGTLIVPPGVGPFPATVFVHGSGAADRETNREGAYLAASRGLAALIFDKRGVGRSSGSLESVTLADLAADGAHAVRFLIGQPEISRGCIGVQGTSQGGWVAPLVAATTPEVAFVITLSGPGVPSDRQELYRRTLNLRGQGYVPDRAFSEADVARAAGVLTAFFSWVRTGRDGDAVARVLREVRGEPWFETTELPDSLDPGAPPAFVEGFRSGMTFDVRATWRGVGVPSLQLFGALDPFVPVDESVAIFRAMQRPAATIRVFDTGDHWMFARDPASPRLPSPGYVPAFLTTISSWLENAVLERCR